MNIGSNKTNTNRNALILIIISALSFSIMGAFVKHLQDIPVFEKVFFRNLISLFIAYRLFIVKQKKDLDNEKKVSIFGEPKNRKYLILRSSLGLTGVILNFYAITHLYLSDSSILMRIAPFFVTITAVLFLKEKVTKFQYFTLIVGFIGAIFVIKPEFDLKILPALAGLIASLCAGVAYTTVRYLKDKEEPETIIFFFSLFSLVVTLPLMLGFDFVLPNLSEVIFLLMTGVFAGIAQIALTYAYKFEKASKISIYNYTGIIFSVIIGFFIWSEIPDWLSIIGGSLIILSAVGSYYYNLYKSKKGD